MKYKVMCEVNFPTLEKTIDVTVPVNKTVGYLCAMLNKMIVENINSQYEIKENSILINKKTGTVYDKNKMIIETDIKNGTKLTYY